MYDWGGLKKVKMNGKRTNNVIKRIEKNQRNVFTQISKKHYSLKLDKFEDSFLPIILGPFQVFRIETKKNYFLSEWN